MGVKPPYWRGQQVGVHPTLIVHAAHALYLVIQGIVPYIALVGEGLSVSQGERRQTADATADAGGSATLDRLRRELARGTAELRVLSLVSSQPRYGYELMKLLGRPPGGVMEVKEGTLYPLLHRLEDADHIRATWEAEGRARPRKYYGITAKGRAHLALLRSEWSGLVDGMQRMLGALDEVDA